MEQQDRNLADSRNLVRRSNPVPISTPSSKKRKASKGVKSCSSGPAVDVKEVDALRAEVTSMAEALVQARCSGELFLKQVEGLQKEKTDLEALKGQAERHSQALEKENKALEERCATVSERMRMMEYQILKTQDKCRKLEYENVELSEQNEAYQVDLFSYQDTQELQAKMVRKLEEGRKMAEAREQELKEQLAVYDRQLQEATTEAGKESLLSSRLREWQAETESLKAQLTSLLDLKNKVEETGLLCTICCTDTLAKQGLDCCNKTVCGKCFPKLEGRCPFCRKAVSVSP